MVTTPWGDATELRARKLRPGGGERDESTEASQRERLFAAIVATVAAKGYEATTIAEVSELSGVSKSSYYELFRDKRDGFLATLEALVSPALAAAPAAGFGGEEERARAGFEAALGLIASQPAAARVCFVESHAGGAAAAAVVAGAAESLGQMLGATFARMPSRAGMPSELTRAIVGGAQGVIRRRLLRDEAAELPQLAPDLWRWMLSIPPPPGRLRAPRTRTVRALPFEDRQRASNPAERLLRALAAAVAEKGYQEAKIADFVERARTSQRTFYEHFESKEDAMVAALDSGSAQMLAAALPAFRRGGDWPHAVRDMEEAILHFAAEEPEYGRLGTTEVYAAGARALEQRELVAEELESLLEPGHELAPGLPAVTSEATGAALGTLAYDFVKRRGPDRLLELLPTFAYVTLAPCLPAERAYEVAIG